jgi:hypothetical protein
LVKIDWCRAQASDIARTQLRPANRTKIAKNFRRRAGMQSISAGFATF